MESSAAAPIIDVEIVADAIHWRDFRRRVLVFLLFLFGLVASGFAIFGMVALLSWQGLPPLTRALIAVGIVIIAMALAIPVLMVGSRKLLSVMRTAGQLTGLHKHLTQWSSEAADYVRKSPLLAPMMLTDFVKAGHFGLIIRRCPVDRQHVIFPFDYPFEPIPLNESDETFRETDDAWAHVKQHATSADRATESNRRRRPPALLLESRRLAAGGGIAWVFFIINPLVQSLTSGGRGIWWRWVAVIMGIVFMILVVQFVVMGSRRVWHMVPGGLVVSTNEMGRRLKQPQLITRSAANVLLNWSPSLRFWAVHVVATGASYRCFLSDSETTMLLRAWLSPLPPPPEKALATLGLMAEPTDSNR